MVLLTALLLSIAVSTVAFGSPPDSISLSLTSDKAIYFKGESIKLTIMLENRSLRDVTMNKRMAHPGPDLLTEIVDSSGNKLRWLPAAPPPVVTKADFTVLGSGQIITATLSDLERALFDKFKQDVYRVKVRYQNRDNGATFNYAAWTGSLVSNTITFEWKG